jgi:hypothetical protein
MFIQVFGELFFSLLKPIISKFEPFDDQCTKAWEKLYTLIFRKMIVGIKTAQMEEKQAK